MIIPNNHSFDVKKPADLVQEYENMVGVGKGTIGSFDPNKYLKSIGHDALPATGLTVTHEPRSDTFKVKTNGKVELLDREIELANKQLETAEAAVKKYPSDAGYKKQVEAAKKVVGEKGKDLQLELGIAKKELEAHRVEFGKAHNGTARQLFDKQTELTQTMNGLEHGNTASFNGLGKHTINVEVKGQKYTLDNSGITKNGKLAKLKPEEFDAVKMAASEHLSDSFTAANDAHAKAGLHMEERYQAQVDKLSSLQKDIETKTKVQEWTGKKTSVLSTVKSIDAEKGVVGEAAYKELGAAGKYGAELKATWNKGFHGKLQTGVGAIGVADGVRRVIKGLTGGSDPEKQADSQMGSLVVGVAEIGGGALLAKLGGKSIAMGK